MSDIELRRAAQARLRQAADELGCPPQSLAWVPAAAASLASFATAHLKDGTQLFFKTPHLAPELLAQWQAQKNAQAAFAAGVGPKVFVTTTRGTLVSARLSGLALSSRTGRDPLRQQQVLSKLRALHRLAKGEDTQGFAHHRPLDTLRQRLAWLREHQRIAPKSHEQCRNWLAWLDEHAKQHRDEAASASRTGLTAVAPEPSNWVEHEGEVFLVDLEDAAIGEPLWDIAAFAMHCSPARALVTDLAAQYFGRSLDASEQKRLDTCILTYALDRLLYWTCRVGLGAWQALAAQAWLVAAADEGPAPAFAPLQPPDTAARRQAAAQDSPLEGRARAAAQELGCDPKHFVPCEHLKSATDSFFATQHPAGTPLIIKVRAIDERTEQRLAATAWPAYAGALAAERAGIGPKVFKSAQPFVLITEYLFGAALSSAQAQHPHRWQQVVRVLHALHHSQPFEGGHKSLNVALPVMRNALLLRARNFVGQGAYTELLEKAAWLDEQANAYGAPSCLRFGDANVLNFVVVDDETFAVDLSESHMGDALADLARFGLTCYFSHARVQDLLSAYCQLGRRDPSADERRRLRLHLMAQHLDYLTYWTLWRGPNSVDANSLLARVREDEALEADYPPLSPLW